VDAKRHSSSIMPLNLTAAISCDNTILSQEAIQHKNLLTRFIHQCRLLDCLEFLAGIGFCGDSAIFILSTWEVL
jgi:hypothetical protein